MTGSWSALKVCLVLLGLGTATVAVVRAGTPRDAASSANAAAGDAMTLGEQLFRHNWARPEQWAGEEPLNAGGDGLGPMFNDVSCIACHSVGGIGGAGGNDRNVEILSFWIPPGSTKPQRSEIFQRARQLHPGLGPQSQTVMLHRFGFGDADQMRQYDLWRAAVLRGDDSDGHPLSLEFPSKVIDGVTYQLAQRSTTPLWGLAEIERLRRTSGKQVRRNLVLKQNGSSSGVSGRVPGTGDGRAGWYGWRGHVGGLNEFILSACAAELGLTVAEHQQSVNPLASDPQRQTALPRPDLSSTQARALTRFVMSLPRPEQLFPSDSEAVADVYSGERVFEKIGCSDCHVSQLGSIKGIYTDLLLHDMGPSLADLSSAHPDPPPSETRPRRRRPRGGYYVPGGPPRTVIPDSPTSPRRTQEWRTPPLWGVADTPPYLHDGRAASLDEAIRLHGGESQKSAEAYHYLPPAEQSQLLDFLGTLRAPQGMAEAFHAQR